ncbi:uncharacterized protein LOC108105946 [Drosophila eugracilis]|uniref:uncharacterized protein LOC108105946 n=1 Tax=Drosophila eugracilis TaxID=29029 RepID=UPI0007E6FDA3|nr:uncharacterized protein LOC108105946 [Drosophila eugracilis]
MSDDEFQELETYEVYPEGSQGNSAGDSRVMPLDASEDAKFSEEMFCNIQERLNRIMKRVSLANLVMIQMKRRLQARIPSTTNVTNTDKMAGGDNPGMFDNYETGNESANE